MELFAAYGHAIAAMAGMALITLILSPLSAMRKTKAGLAPGATPAQDYGNPVYRWHRAYSNASETTGSFALVTAAAILAGASPVWVNWLASLFLVSRVVMLIIHLGALGRPDMSLRSFAYVAGWLCCVLLGIAALCAILGG